MTTATTGMTVREVSQSLDRPVDRSTVGRWVTRGVLSPSGERVFLRAKRLGGRLVVKQEAMAAFLAALNPDGGERAVAP
jgi:hypothetical protein